MGFLHVLRLSNYRHKDGLRPRIGPIEGQVLALVLILTNGLIWFVALYGALRLRSYVQAILKTPDGSGFARIDVGLFMLVLSLILPSFLGSVVRATTAIPELIQPLTLATNYSYTVLPFFVFGTIYLGTGLTKLVNRELCHSPRGPCSSSLSSLSRRSISG